MSTVRRIARNTGFLVGSTLLQKFITLILIIVIARELGVEAFGLYSFAFAFPVMFLVFMDLGLSSLLVRDSAKDMKKVSALLGESVVLKLLLMVFSFAVIFFSISILGYDSYVTLIVSLAALSFIFDSMAGLFRSVFFAFERMEFELVVNTSYKVLLLALSLLVLFTGHGILGLVIANVIASLFNVVLSIAITLAKFTKPKIAISLPRFSSLLWKSLPFCFIAVFASFYSNIDIAMLHFFKGNIAVGLYSVAFRLVNTLSLISVGFISAVYPTMIKFFARAKESTPVLMEKSFYYLLIPIMPIAFAALILSDRVISVFFGADFASAGIILTILIWFSVLNFMNFAMVKMLNSLNRERFASLLFGVTLAVNIVLNYFWIPHYSFIGAAFASVLSEIVFFILGYRIITKYFKDLSVIRIVVKPIAASIVMLACIYFLQPLNIWVIIILGAVIYFVSLFALKAFSEVDLMLFRNLVKR